MNMRDTMDGERPVSAPTPKPQWTLNLTWHEDGTIATVTFGMETYRPITSSEEAVTDLAAVIHWWLDTKQYIHPNLAAEGA